MKTQHFFVTDAALVNRLGRELVARQETALVELIKNSFDADATDVEVVLHEQGEPALEIRDNGTGMSLDDLVNGFLRLANDNKVREPLSPRFMRQRAGRKGIGRFSAQRLGDHLTLTTRREDMDTAVQLTVDWSQFTRGRELSEVSVTIETEIPLRQTGTLIRIQRLADPWTDAQIRRCWRSVIELQQPFPIAPVEDRPVADPGFKVRFVRGGQILTDDSVIADLNTEVLSHLHAAIELQVSSDGIAQWRLTRNAFGPDRGWTPIHHGFPEQKSPPPYELLRNVYMRTFYAVLDPTLFSPFIFTRLRDVLAEQGGVRLYRNGFRVVPYGDPDNDWLRLDEMYAKRSVLAPIANRNFFGVVQVTDPEGHLFDEHTSREGLIESSAFAELRRLISSVLSTAVLKIAEDRGRKSRAGQKKAATKNPENDTAFDEVQNAFDVAKHAVDTVASAESIVDAKTAADAAALAVTAATRAFQARRAQISEAESQLANEAAMLRFLATLGMATAEFSHETGMTFDAFRLDFTAVFSAVQQLFSENSALADQAQRAQKMLNRLDALTSYLNVLAGARAARGLRPASITRSILDFIRGVEAQAKSQGILIESEVPAYDALHTRPMHDAELASILLNLYTNSVKAIKRSAIVPRRILIVGDRPSDSNDVRLRFLDTGDGIPQDNREKVFDAFFTTRNAPPTESGEISQATGAGLGLWIVQQITANVRGEVTVVDPPQGFSTCIELTIPAEGEDER